MYKTPRPFIKFGHILDRNTVLTVYSELWQLVIKLAAVAVHVLYKLPHNATVIPHKWLCGYIARIICLVLSSSYWLLRCRYLNYLRVVIAYKLCDYQLHIKHTYQLINTLYIS